MYLLLKPRPSETRWNFKLHSLWRCTYLHLLITYNGIAYTQFTEWVLSIYYSHWQDVSKRSFYRKMEIKKTKRKTKTYIYTWCAYTKSRVQSMNNKLRGSEQYNSVRQLLSIAFAFNIAMRTTHPRPATRAIHSVYALNFIYSGFSDGEKKMETKICCVQVERLKRIGICSNWMSTVHVQCSLAISASTKHKCVWHRGKMNYLFESLGKSQMKGFSMYFCCCRYCCTSSLGLPLLLLLPLRLYLFNLKWKCKHRFYIQIVR